MKKQYFTTSLEACKFSITDSPDGSGLKTFSGYAITWGQLSSDRGGYKVRLQPNSAKYEATSNVFALYNHEGGKILGSTDNKTLTLTPDSYGVKAIITPKADTSHYRDTLAMVAAGEVKGMSFSMTGPVKYTDLKEGGEKVREFSSFNFDEVTICGAPAFEGTSIAAYSDIPFNADTPNRNEAARIIEGLRLSQIEI